MTGYGALCWQPELRPLLAAWRRRAGSAAACGLSPPYGGILLSACSLGQVTTPDPEGIAMSDRVLRGTRLGSVSYESDRHTEFAPRLQAIYDCPEGHETTMPFAAEADVPPRWECRVCGGSGLLRDGEQPEAKPTKPTRTHWDMLLERRSVAELEEVLAERLTVLHDQQGRVKAAAKSAERDRKKSA
jgi:hypothetical protein